MPFKKSCDVPVLDTCMGLSEEAIVKAKNELFEPDDQTEHIQMLNSVIQDSRDNDDIAAEVFKICSKKDNAFLVRFLRARKWNVDRAYALLKGYASFRLKYPELFEDLTDETIKGTLEAGYPSVLPHRDRYGRVVLAFKIEHWDPVLTPFDEILRGFVYILENLLKSQETQVNGLVLFENFYNYSLTQALSIKPHQLKKMVEMLQCSFPCRLKGVHFIHQPWYFSWSFALTKPFLKEKLSKRVHIHGDNLEEFYDEFGKEWIPFEFSGDNNQLDQISWTKEFFDFINIIYV
ncbi:retinaldehyde-binding protein 1-like [Antedon mediterranea]|uniref:retinaldehyde-binding protein 1-like n=1 Tax=Antedon mediterranea TaxID=105859 RepID=UPI003AF63AA7